MTTRFASPVATLGVALLAVAAIAATAHGIVIRHDRDPQAYLELGARFDAVCQVGVRMGDGTLVAPDRILTAAHVARGLQRRGAPVVRCGGADYTVIETYLHPDWRDMGPHDVAVLFLETPVVNVEPLDLYRSGDETGRTAILVGHGMTGTGDSRDRNEDGRRRGATNVIEESNDRFVRFHFDAPPGGTDLEGIPGGGDSGGPALIEVDGDYLVAGVSSLGEPGANGPGTYGANDYFVRVSTHLSWIESALAGEAEPYRPQPATIPAGAAGDRFNALRALIEAGADADVEAFIDQHLVPATDRRAARIEALAGLVADFAGASMEQIVERTASKIVAVFATADGPQLLGVELEGAAPHRIAGVIRGRP